MEIIVKILQFFFCFTLLVGLHEFGHFIVARLFKIRVEKFYIFFDPWFHLLKIKPKKEGGTEFGLGWLPLGGYVKIAGMVDESMDKEQMKQPAQPDEFRAKPAWQRLCVMIAGVVMNFIVAVIIYIGVSFTWGEQYLDNRDIKWGYDFNEAGEQLGFVDGDKIVAIDGEEVVNYAEIVPALLITDKEREITVERNGEKHSVVVPMEDLIAMRQAQSYVGLLTPRMPFIVDSVTNAANAARLMVGDQITSYNGVEMYNVQEYQLALQDAKSSEGEFTVLRGGESLSLTLDIDDQGRIGVLSYSPVLRTKSYTFWQAIPAGFNKTGQMVASYWDQLKMIFQPKTKMYKEIGGFMAIGNMFSGVWNWYDFWMKTAFLSIMLGVLNLVPIPGLDGGHTMFTLWEVITRRKPNEKFEEIAQYIGMAILLLLIFYANGNDFYRIFFK